MIRNLKAIYIQALVGLALSAISYASPGPDLDEVGPDVNWPRMAKSLSLKPTQLIRLQMLQSQSAIQIRRIHCNKIYRMVQQQALVQGERLKFKKAVYGMLTMQQAKALQLEGDFGVLLGDPNPLALIDQTGVTETQREQARTIFYMERRKIAQIQATPNLGRRQRAGLIASVSAERRDKLGRILTRTQLEALVHLRESQPSQPASFLFVGDN